jgi:hypothetical protein
MWTTNFFVLLFAVTSFTGANGVLRGNGHEHLAKLANSDNELSSEPAGNTSHHDLKSPNMTTTTKSQRDMQGSCGEGIVGNGICEDGSCCSAWGWCGTSTDHCGSGGYPACSGAKKVRIDVFCINGDDDAGAYGEHQIRLNGNTYYPSSSSDCSQCTSGFCDWREGQCHNLQGAQFVVVNAFQSINVGTEEHDSTSENDSAFATLSSNDWYNPTCDSYEVKFSKDFKSEQERKVCWNVGASVSGTMGEINAGIEDCTTWTDPAESFVWLMTVEPNEIF